MRNLSKRLWEIQRRERIYFWVEGRGGFWYFSTKLQINLKNSVQFSSVAQLCPTLCDPVNCSTPGLPVHHQLLEFTQTHVHQVDVPSSHLILCHPLLLLPPRICRFNPWVRKIPWRRKWHPIPVFLPGESHGQRSLVGHSPQGRKQKLKESRMDEKEWLFSTKDDKWMTRTNLRLKLQIDSWGVQRVQAEDSNQVLTYHVGMNLTGHEQCA